MTIHIPFFSDCGYEPMVEWLRLVVGSLEIWVQFPHGAEFFCSAAAILHGTEPVSALTRALFIAVLSIFFLGGGFVSGDLALTTF